MLTSKASVKGAAVAKLRQSTRKASGSVTFPVAGVGAVAGGLEALEELQSANQELTTLNDELQSQELYRLVAENTRDLVSLHSADGKYTYASPSSEKLLGYGQREIIGKLPADLSCKDDRRKVALAYRTAARSANPTQVTYCITVKDRRKVWLEALISPITNGSGKVTRLLTASRDVTERKISDDRLRESEFTVRTLVECASQGIVVIDSTGRIIMANRAAELMFGYRKDELLSVRILDLVPIESRARHKGERMDFFRNPKTRRMTAGPDIRGHRRDGTEFPAAISLGYIQSEQRMLGVAFVTDLSERKRSEAALQEGHDKLLDLSRKLIAAQDEERKHMSRELHDAFSQELAALTTESRLLKRELPLQAQSATQRIEKIAQRIAKLATDIQQMSRRLHPAILDDLGLMSALRSECHAFSELYGIQTSLTTSRVPGSVPGNVALCIYRITQEGLQNVVKHSGASHARVDLGFKNGEIRLVIRDSGVGFDTYAQKRTKYGMGLVGMEERARLVGGTLTIQSTPKKGTRVLVRIPFVENRR
jgi:PAS domain S-box-containing protein